MEIDFNTPAYAANGTIAYISSMSEIVSLKDKNFGLRDPADNQVLETAMVGMCNYLITGDKDLLCLKNYDQIQIITPTQFIAKFTSKKKS